MSNDKKKNITNEDLVYVLNFPPVILKNTYFWHSNPYASARRYAEERVINEMLKAIENVVDTTIHEIKVNGNSIYIDGVKVFSYKESAKNVYKTQNLGYVKECIKPEIIENIYKSKMLRLMGDIKR